MVIVIRKFINCGTWYTKQTPTGQYTVSRLVAGFHETGSAKDFPKTGYPKFNDDTKFNILLEAEENPNLSLHQEAKKQEKIHPYKIL